MKHLNEDRLIKYAFDLLETEQQKEAADHLEQCGDCRANLKRIQQQFAALNVLDEDTALTEELVFKTLAGKKDASGDLRRRAIMPWVEWVAAAAAVILVCVLFLQDLPDTHVKDSAPGGADKPIAKLDTPASFSEQSLISHSERGEESHRYADAQTLHSVQGDISADAKVVSANAIPDEPPFAPASAIELVVLPKPDAMQLTIYNSADLTLVRDTRKLTLKPGWNWLQFMWDGTLIDPTSLSLAPLEDADKIDIQQLVYPARLKDIGRWLIRSEVEGSVPFEITYFASGLSWRAFYMGTMNPDETTMNLKGYVNVANNSGQDFKNAQTRLIVGETHLIEQIPELARRHYPYGPEIMEEDTKDSRKEHYFARLNLGEKEDGKIPMLGDMPIIGTGVYGIDADSFSTGFKGVVKTIEKEGLSEYFLYTIEGTEDLPNTWAKRLPSFDVDDIPVKSLYKYDEDRYGKQAVRFVSFANDTEHELGTTPIPEGNVKLYRNLNDVQNLSYIGQSSVKYIPVNEDVELNLGGARLVKVEPVLVETQTNNYIYDNHGNISGWDDIETWQMKLTNTRDIPVDIEITRNFETDYWDIELNNSVGTAHPTYKKHDKSRARFTLTLSPQSKKTFAYTVTKYQGRRSEVCTNKLQEQEK